MSKLINRKKYKGFSTESLKGMQEYHKIALDGIIGYLPEKIDNFPRAKREFLKFRASEILRIKKQLNAIFRELVFRKLAGKNHEE